MFTIEDVEQFRKELDIPIMDFCHFCGISPSGYYKIKKGTMGGKYILQRIEYISNSPRFFDFNLRKNGKHLHSSRQQKLRDYLNKWIEEQINELKDRKIGDRS